MTTRTGINTWLLMSVMLIFVLLISSMAAAKTITVDDDGPADYDNIQAAINAAVNGDTVIVADGTYTGDGNRDIDFIGKGITVKSETGPQNCTVDCGYLGVNGYDAFSFIKGEGPASVLEGFTITGCYASTGAIFCRNSSPVIKNCVIIKNIGRRGSALQCVQYASPKLINCTIIHNWSEATFSRGGAVYCEDSNPVLINCTITNNFSEDTGGGIYCEDGTVTLTNCIIWGNEPEEIHLVSSSLSATCSCIQGGWEGEFNIDVDPMLTCNGHLQMDSPCIDWCPNGPADDIDGETRPVDIVGRGNDNMPVARTLDIGSDELCDSDSDSLPDWWETKYFGSTTNAEPNDNPDGDDDNNLEEYILSTNPLGAYYVDDANGNNNWDGCAVAWDGMHGPKKSIQAAINSSSDGDRLIVLDGIYSGPGNIDIDFRGKAITLESRDGPEGCIIDCQAGVGDIHRGFYFHWRESNRSILKGLTVTNGRMYEGGGIYCKSSSPTIDKCNIVNNYSRARDGGAIFCCSGSNPKISDCIISDNIADDDGGGVFCTDYSTAEISNCIICNNRADRDGGGIASWYSSDVLLKGCIITRNHAGRDGGGVVSFHDSPVLVDCLVSDNSADSSGGGIYVNDGPNFKITNCTIANNVASSGGGVKTHFYSSTKLDNSILYGNVSNQISLTYHSTAQVQYTNVEGGWPGLGNFDVDPQFVDQCHPDPNERDYNLLPDSPCIDAGDPCYVAEPNEKDLAGNPRVIDGRIDMGAYEFVPMIEVAMKFTPQALNLSSGGKLLKAHFVLPEGFSVEDVDANTPAVIEPFGVESYKIKVKLDDEGLVRIVATFRRSHLCNSITGYDENIEVTVIGRLTSGQYFYGTDIIKVTDRAFEALDLLVSHWLEGECSRPDWCGGADINQDSVVNFADFAMFDGCCFEVVKE